MRTSVLVFVLLAGGLHGQGGAALAGAGYAAPDAIEVAPGQVMTLFFRGVKPDANGQLRNARASSDPLPTTLAGLRVQVAQPGVAVAFPAPILAVKQENECGNAQLISPLCLLTAVKVQIPFELMFVTPAVILPMPAAQVILEDETGPSRGYNLRLLPDNAHVLTSCDAAWDLHGGEECVRTAYHADGRAVSAGAPARIGEPIVVYAYGLGQTVPEGVTGTGAKGPTSLKEHVRPGTGWGLPVWVNFRREPLNASAATPRRLDDAALNDPGVALEYAGAAPGQTGLYQINVRVPSNFSPVAACGPEVRSNALMTVTTIFGTENIPICVQ